MYLNVLDILKFSIQMQGKTRKINVKTGYLFKQKM